MCAVKFARPDELPEGFLYGDDFLSKAEEAELLRIFHGLDFAAYDYHGYQAKRRVFRFGVNYDINTRALTEMTQPIPDYLIAIRERAAEFAEVSPDALVQAMVSEYTIGAPIGWHRDAPQFGTIVGVSLGSACRMRLKPYRPVADESEPRQDALIGIHRKSGLPSRKLLSLQLQPRSIYVMRGAARSQWQHSIPPVDAMRYSITFRTLRSKVAGSSAA